MKYISREENRRRSNEEGKSRLSKNKVLTTYLYSQGFSVVVVDMQEKRQSFDEPSSKQNDQIECTPAHATSFDDS